MAEDKIMGKPTAPKTEEQKADELEKLRAWVKKVLPDSWDKYDVQAKYDSTLNLSENKTAMREDLKVLITDMKSQVEYTKAQQERIEHEQIKKAEAEVAEYNNSLRFEEIKDLNQFYAPIIRGVNKMCQGFSNLLFVKSRGGVGKSYQIRKALITNNADFIEIAGDVTEAYLYRLIYDNNGKIIYFKDVVKLLMGLNSMNLLKGATETEAEKVLTKCNYSKDQADLPDRFLCKCKFIFDYNNLFGTQLAPDFEALTSRGDYLEIPFCDDDIKKVMRMVVKDDWQKEVTEEIIKNFEANGMVKLNLRTQWKGLRTYEYAKKNNLDWKKELEQEMRNISKTRAMLYTLIGNKAIRTADLKRLLLKQEILPTLRTADHKINEWLYLEELYKIGENDKNFYVCINPPK
jgi:hypothetical protein